MTLLDGYQQPCRLASRRCVET